MMTPSYKSVGDKQWFKHSISGSLKNASTTTAYSTSSANLMTDTMCTPSLNVSTRAQTQEEVCMLQEPEVANGRHEQSMSVPIALKQ